VSNLIDKMSAVIIGDDVHDALQSVIDGKVNWVILSFSPKTNKLTFTSEDETGKNCIDESVCDDLLEELSEGRIHFVYLRQSVEHAHTVKTKTLLVTWCGQGCSTAVKAQFQAIVTELDNYMSRFHMVLAAKVAAKTEDELRYGLKEQLWRLSESKQA